MVVYSAKLDMTNMRTGRTAKKQTASMEDYLETIAMLSRDKPAVRVSEIGRALGVKMPSVTSALHKLVAEGLVEHDRYGHVLLAPEGKKIAEDVLRRHEMLYRFLSEVLHVDAQTAVEDACKMEHSLSPESLEKLAAFIDSVSR